MIILNKIDKEEYEEVNLILKKENIKDILDNGIIYTLKENDVIMGVGKIKFEFNYGVLEYIVIKEEHRGANLGEALLRTLLFKAETSGIEKVFYIYKNNYLIKNGFANNRGANRDLYSLYLEVSNFFNMGCRGDKNEF